eukprot:jgi/Tetstr1/442187/TSEL_030337.t1
MGCSASKGLQATGASVTAAVIPLAEPHQAVSGPPTEAPSSAHETARRHAPDTVSGQHVQSCIAHVQGSEMLSVDSAVSAVATETLGNVPGGQGAVECSGKSDSTEHRLVQAPACVSSAGKDITTSDQTDPAERGAVKSKGSNEDIIGTNNGEGTEVAGPAPEQLQARYPLPPHPSDRGVPVRWLLGFFVTLLQRRMGGTLDGELRHTTTKEVVEGVVKPLTAACKSAFVEVMDCCRPPEFFMSHTWHRPFRELVHCLTERFREAPDTIVWVDIFAFNQHLTFEQMKADLDTLAETVARTQRTLVVMDPEGVCFTRAWCLKEHHEAVKAGGGGRDDPGKLEVLPYCVETREVDKLAGMMYNLQVEKATAFKPEDKDMILAEIQSHEGGAARFNTVLKGALRSAVAAMVGLLPAGTEEHTNLMDIAGRLLLKGGDYGKAQPLLEGALEARRSSLGETHADTLASLHHLADLHKEKGEYSVAELLFLKALDGRRSALGERHADTLQTVYFLGWLQRLIGNYEAAEPLLLQALDGRQAVLGEEHPDTLQSMNGLGILYEARGNYAAAERLKKQALVGRRSVLGEEHPDTLHSLNNLAVLYEIRGQHGAAEPLYKQALEGRRAALGEAHPDTLASAMNLAAMYQGMRNYLAAETLYRQALDGYSAALGVAHPDTLLSVMNLAALYFSKGEYRLAEPLYKQSLEGFRATLGEAHPDTQRCRHSLALLQATQAAAGTAQAATAAAVAAVPMSAAAPACPAASATITTEVDLILHGGDHSATAIADPAESGAPVQAAPTTEAAADNLPPNEEDKAEEAKVAGPAPEQLQVRYPLPPHPSDRGVPVRWLLGFFVTLLQRRMGGTLDGELRHTTTKEVVEGVVKPLTAACKCTFVEVMDCCRPPEFFMSHTWHRPFRELVHCLTERFREAPDTIVWVDIFAFNQHLTFEQMKADLDTLAETVARTQRTLVVMDPEGVCFTRAWCLKEHHEAVKAGGGGRDDPGKLEILPYCVETREVDKLARMMYNLQVEKATAFKPEDKDMILAEIQSHEGGAARFNTVLKGALRSAVAAMVGLLPAGTEEHTNLMDIAGRLLLKGGDYGKAQPLLEGALEARRSALGETHVDTLASLHHLAHLHKDKGEYSAAEPLFLKALDGRRSALGERHADTLQTVYYLGDLHREKGDYGRAEAMAKQALEGRQEVLGAAHPDTLRSIHNLAALHETKGEYEAAELLSKRALEGRRSALGEEHPDTMESINDLAVLYANMGNYDAAEPLYKQALEGYSAALGEAHPETLVSTNNLGVLYHTKGDYAAAEQLYKQALEGYIAALGAAHPDTLGSMMNVAVLYKAKGDDRAAEELYKQVLQGRQAALGEAHPDTLTSIELLGVLYHSQGKYGEAEPLFKQALEGWRAALGEAHPDTLMSIMNLANLHEAKGDFHTAEPLYMQALDGWRAALGETHPDTQDCIRSLAKLHMAMGK